MFSGDLLSENWPQLYCRRTTVKTVSKLKSIEIFAITGGARARSVAEPV
jgi:hypothetical protein